MTITKERVLKLLRGLYNKYPSEVGNRFRVIYKAEAILNCTFEFNDIQALRLVSNEPDIDKAILNFANITKIG
jgi:hypothetical protein